MFPEEENSLESLCDLGSSEYFTPISFQIFRLPERDTSGAGMSCAEVTCTKAGLLRLIPYDKMGKLTQMQLQFISRCATARDPNFNCRLELGSMLREKRGTSLLKLYRNLFYKYCECSLLRSEHINYVSSKFPGIFI